MLHSIRIVVSVAAVLIVTAGFGCGSDTSGGGASEAAAAGEPSGFCVAVGSSCPTDTSQQCDGFCDTTHGVCACVQVNTMLQSAACQTCCAGSHVVPCSQDTTGNYCGAGSPSNCESGMIANCNIAYVCRAD